MLYLERTFRPTGGIRLRAILQSDCLEIIRSLIRNDANFGCLFLTEVWAARCFSYWLWYTSILWETFTTVEADAAYEAYQDRLLADDIDCEFAAAGAHCGCFWVGQGRLTRCLTCDLDW